MKPEELLQQHDLDALLVTTPENVRYLSGFSAPQDARVILTQEGALLLTDGRYTVQAREESRIPYRILGRHELLEALKELLKGRVGFEAAHLPYAQYERYKATIPAEWVPTHGLIETLRLRKTPEEIEKIRAAAALTDQAFTHILPQIRPGVREIEIALELERFLRTHGAEDTAFEIIVASGPRSAMPHGTASPRTIQSGELVTLDFGARVDGYHSDMTRTLAVGPIPDELRRIYDAVLAAQEAALQAVAPGRAARELDRIAREVLAQHGYAEYFTHSLGHGVGLAVHEGPALWRESEDVLESGMILTIEPGVYIPDVGGCRIEDLVLVTADGFEVLSQTPKHLIQV
ncbi:M24 family metallopeptidase [Marinithermus hydrothermalis]|uniref:Peptidase M24 n=1 Tax=Marinithermus hydrothermalis (strain DSM 14884 / JCM 11576 / T1) TaxID=869210 RepID=F2NQL0_MARHT|nr:Xaa-Pro peptidase family protein [Marinithermus hydrothermalis]AEB11948.1 peptidase M24 [Marinithermus hydrothermalis DSM 14884]